MKKIIFLLCMLPSFVLAQEVTNETRTVSCINQDNLDKLVTEFDEVPFIRALSSLNIDVQQLSSLVIFVNSKTNTFSIVEKIHKEKYCILAVGGSFEPVPAEIVKRFNEEKQKKKL